MKLRVGRSLGRTIYLQSGEEPSKDDEFLGILETKELAQAVVDALNATAVGPFMNKTGFEGK